jgi:hypothetical protein
MTAIEMLRLIAKSSFREFTQDDWRSFNGCESDNPLISDAGAEGYIIVDGENVEYSDEYGGYPLLFKFSKIDY